MKYNKGITLINMVVIIMAMIIIAGVTIMSGKDIIDKAKNSKKEENLASIKAVVNMINTKLSTAGVFTPANSITLYGTSAITPSGDVANWINVNVPNDADMELLSNWYLLVSGDIAKMDIQDLDEQYIVNYKANIVYPYSNDAISQIVNDLH